MVLEQKHREYLNVEHAGEHCSQNGGEDYFVSLYICVYIYGYKQFVTMGIPHY